MVTVLLVVREAVVLGSDCALKLEKRKNRVLIKEEAPLAIELETLPPSTAASVVETFSPRKKDAAKMAAEPRII